jgi:hypothetical protein
MPKHKPLPLPDHLVYHETFDNESGAFELGESVWVDGWPKSKSATFTIQGIVLHKRTGQFHVNLWCEKRGTAQSHSIDPARILKRRKPRDRTATV